MARLTGTSLWHVYANGEWLATEYDGYSPVNVLISGRYHPVVYAHLSAECTRPECAALLTLALRTEP